MHLTPEQTPVTNEKVCDCPFCEPCKCNHRADEHLVGEGQCFLCECHWFTPKDGTDQGVTNGIQKGQT